MDHLFHLPPTYLYTTRAYWLPQPLFTSILYVAQPSEALYNELMDYFRNVEHKSGMFDMNVANEALGNTVSLLPSTLACLNGDFKRAPDVIAPPERFYTVGQLAELVHYVHYTEAPLGGCEYPVTPLHWFLY